MRNFLWVIMVFSFICCKDKGNIHPDIQNKRTTEASVSSPDTTTKQQKKIIDLPLSKLKGIIYSDINDIKVFQEYYSGGSVIGGVINNKEYTISRIRGEGDVTKYILFEESLGSKGLDGKFKIIDILDLTTNKYDILKNSNFGVHHSFCYLDGKNDQEIIAIARIDDDKEFFTTIYKAWRADRKTEKIIEISTEGITVENVGYGL